MFGAVPEVRSRSQEGNRATLYSRGAVPVLNMTPLFPACTEYGASPAIDAAGDFKGPPRD